MRSTAYFAELQGARVLAAIRANGSITQDQATTLGIRRLAAVVHRLRSKGWGFTSVRDNTVTGSVIVRYTFTVRQKAQPETPIYQGSAPKESRYFH